MHYSVQTIHQLALIVPKYGPYCNIILLDYGEYCIYLPIIQQIIYNY